MDFTEIIKGVSLREINKQYLDERNRSNSKV